MKSSKKQQVRAYPVHALHITQNELEFLFYLFHEMYARLSGYHWKIEPIIETEVDLTFDVEYGIFDTYLTILKKVDHQLLEAK